MRPTVLLLAALLLAGCAAPAAPAEPEPPRAPAAQVRDVPVGGTLTARAPLQCPGPVSCSGPDHVLLLQLLGNETALHARLDVAYANTPTDPAPVRVTLRCEGAAACAQPLDQAEGVPPLALEADLALPAGITLLVEGEAVGDLPSFSFTAPFLEATGTVRVAATPGPPVAPQRIKVQVAGAAGLCGLLVEENCSTFPSGASRDYAVAGPLRRVALNATWDAVSPATGTMRLIAGCRTPTGLCPTPPVEAEGPSPLRLDVTLPASVPQSSITVRMAFTTPMGVPLRQEYAVEGFLEYLPLDG